MSRNQQNNWQDSNQNYRTDHHQQQQQPRPSFQSSHQDSHYENTQDFYYENNNSQAHLVPAVAPGAPSYPPLPSPQNQNYNYPNSNNYFQGGNGYGSPVQPSYQRAEYSIARERLMEKREKKEIELTDGNLVIDLPVPRSLPKHNFHGEDMSQESGFLRYTAVTGDPNDFTRSHFKLRQSLNGRETELAIFLTMYNEDEVLFTRTFTSIIKNIQYLQSRTKSKTWGPNAWKKVVVCVVSDGRGKINPRTLKVLGLYGAFQDGVMKNEVDGKEVTAHLFEYTSQVVVAANGEVSGGDGKNAMAPIQMIFCLKELNKKKLNSHRWCFNAFCPQLRPNVCVLLDAGTRPSGTSIYSLWKAFDKNKNVGGACGEITVDTGRGCGNLLNVLVAAQNFEYKMSNILDKPLESIFGFISVLPGAFSAYRYKALLNGRDGQGPLQAYFLGEKMHEAGSTSGGLSASNMYLAEDRVLAFELVCKKNESWTMKYVKSAKASTDVPDTVPEFISQRRRWNNGALFAAIHSTTHFYRIWTSGQGFFRKFFLTFLSLYNAVQLIFQFIGLSSFYLAFFFICHAAISDPAHPAFGSFAIGSEIISILNSLYISLIAIIIVVSLGNKPASSKFAYTGVMFGLAVIFGIALYCVAWTIYLAVPHTLAGWKDINALLHQSGFRDIVLSLGSTYFLYIIASLLHAEPWHLFTSFIQYMFLLPSFVSVLSIYSISNLQDLAWGTKGSTTVKDLGGASTLKNDSGKKVVELSIPTRAEDVDELWLHARKDLAVTYVEVHVKRDADTKKTDQFANQRTNWLLTYLGVNMAIVVFFSSTFWTSFLAANQANKTGPIVNYYMVGIFWSTAGLSAIRFIGSTLYLIFRLFGF